MHVSDIEKDCGRSIVIETTEHADSLAKCNSQYQSPLFSTLPREIRDLIWTFATAPIEDRGRKYADNEYYCRPGHRAPHKTYTDLLSTCRRVWLEANALPMLQAEHCFWYYREAPDGRSPAWMASLTEANRRNFGHLHLFAQMFAIENLRDDPGELRRFFLETEEREGDFQPRELHVTLRHTDWYWWEHDDPLRLDEEWVQALLNSPDLRSTQVLRLEMETLDYKVKQLIPIVERLKGLESREYESHVVDGEPVTTKFVLDGESTVETWTGPADIDGGDFDPYEGKSTLNYHIITLTWRLRFPSLPRAHIPTLRRAPRIRDSQDPAPLPPDSTDPLPKPPSASKFHHRPPSSGGPSDVRRMNRRVRLRLRRCEPPYESREEEDTHRWFAEAGRQKHMWAFSKWRADVWLCGERERWRRGMEGVRREGWEERWVREGSLLRFE